VSESFFASSSLIFLGLAVSLSLRLVLALRANAIFVFPDLSVIISPNS